MQPDNELLRQYARAGSESAFAELVKRHVDLVYSAALRQAGGDAHLAHDVAQSVFTDLARKASSLCRRESLTGWLYTSAHFAASKMVRTEIRRREREEQFMREPGHDTAADAEWEKLRPILDAAMHGLKESEREAVLLRYFENRPYAEVGAKLGVNENTARMRVERALEKLRALLAKRGIATGTGLATVLSTNAVQTAPGTLAASLASVSLAGAGTGNAFFNMMNASNLKMSLGALLVAGVATVFVVQHLAQQSLRAQNESLTQQLAQLKNNHGDFSNQLSDAADSPSDEQHAELLRLRAEVTRLRTIKNQPPPVPVLATNDVTEKKKTAINLKVRFLFVPAREMPAIGVGWAPAGDGASLLSKEQLDLFLKTLKKDQLINEAQITDESGREAKVLLTQPVSIDGTNAHVGVTMDVVPYFSTDSSTFTLNLVAELNELTGGPARPGLQTLQASNHVNLFPSQTAALQRDVPPGGWLPDSGNTSDGATKFLVFVTPTIVNAEVNPHPPKNIVIDTRPSAGAERP